MEPVVVKYSRVKLLFCTIPPFFFAVSGIVLMFRDFLPGLFFFLLFGSCSGYIIFLVCKAKDMLLIAPNGFTLFKRMKNPIFIPWADVEEIFVYKFFPYPFQIGYRLNLLGVTITEAAARLNPCYPRPRCDKIYTNGHNVHFLLPLFLANKNKKKSYPLCSSIMHRARQNNTYKLLFSFCFFLVFRFRFSFPVHALFIFRISQIDT